VAPSQVTLLKHIQDDRFDLERSPSKILLFRSRRRRLKQNLSAFGNTVFYVKTHTKMLNLIVLKPHFCINRLSTSDN
jgi:hypothetical protein